MFWKSYCGRKSSLHQLLYFRSSLRASEALTDPMYTKEALYVKEVIEKKSSKNSFIQVSYSAEYGCKNQNVIQNSN